MPDKQKNINPQKVPEGYFEGLTDKIMDRVELENSALLNDHSLKRLPFQVPEKYFDNLTDHIDQKSNRKEGKVVRLWAQQWLKYAASFLLFLSAAFVINQLTPQKSEVDILSQLTETEIIDYLSTQEVALDELLVEEEVIELVLDDFMAEIAYNYSDMIDFEVDDLYFEQ